MTTVGRRPTTPRSGGAARRRQAEYWDARYRSEPTFFGEGASPFLSWVLAAPRGHAVQGPWVELGSGYGRDLAELRRRGIVATGVDVSQVGSSLAKRSGLTIDREHALRFLARLPPASVHVVFSNLFLNMEFSEKDHERIFAQVHRVLVPRGYHAYSVRDVADRWCGRGRAVGPQMFDLAPDGPVLHFFSRAYAQRLRRDRFARARTWQGRERGEFPIHVLYVLDQKPGAGPDGSDRTPKAPVTP